MSKLKIGWAEISITPDRKVSLCGQFYERVSEYVETEITATAMAIESDGEHLVICSCDLEGIGSNLIKGIREKLKGVEGLNPDNVILHATHSHTSINYTSKRLHELSIPLEMLEKLLGDAAKKKEESLAQKYNALQGDEALEYLINTIPNVIKQAWENRKSAYYTNEFGRAAVGLQRRVCFSDGSAKMWGDTNSATFTELEYGCDTGMELLYVFDENKELTGIVINLSCPSQVLEQRSFISSDFWGKVKIYLRERFGEHLYVLALCGPAGDQCPRDLIRWVDPETPIDDPNVEQRKLSRKAGPSMYDVKGTWKIGRRISREVIDVYDEISKEDLKACAILTHEKIMLDVPVRRVTPKEYEQAKKRIEEFKNKANKITIADNAAMHVYAGTISRYEKQETFDTYPAEIHVARFADIAIATNPFELFLVYGDQIRARSMASQTFLIQLACGADGYLPTEKAEKGGHYSAYVSSGITGHEGGDLLVRKTLAKIKEFFE